MEVKINKEIRDYTESIFFGLSLRQLIFSGCAIAIAVALYFGIKQLTDNTDIITISCVLGAFPFALLGFFNYNGMNAEQFILAWVKSEILMPLQLKFKAVNIYEEVYKEVKNENIKTDKQRG